MVDVAGFEYGVTTLKFTCGSIKTILQAILTAKYTHIISFYMQSCNEINYSMLFESTLHQILKELKPFQRHSVAGLDGITTDGVNGFTVLKKAASLHCSQKDVLIL